MATAVADILQGPEHYLVLMGNNAEMRAGSGAFLEAGVLTTSDGELHLSDVVPTRASRPPPGPFPSPATWRPTGAGSCPASTGATWASPPSST